MTGDQADEIFAEIIAGDEEWAAKAIEEAPKQELPPVKPTGLSYTGDTVSAVDHTPQSTYVFAWEGKRLFNVYVDLGVTLPLPEGVPAHIVSAHPIRIVSLDYLTSIDTNGMAFVAKHEDDGLVHVDGTTVLTYVGPRAMRYVAKLYGK